MVVPSYPLARPPAGTDVHSLPVEKVSQAILFSHLRTAELIEPSGTLIPVRLVPDLVRGGWRVRWGYGTIGSLPAGIRQVFRDIDRVHAIRQEPAVRARVCINRDRGLLDVSVELPAPELAVPWNSLPEGTSVLPQGRRFPVELPDVDGPDRQLLGLLDGVEVTVDGAVIATLDPLIAHRMQEHLAGPGSLGVRVFVVGGAAFLDVDHGEPESIHPLAEPVPPPPPEPAPDLSGPWSVTVDGVELVDPLPTGSRIVPSPVVDSNHVDR
ncbi:hypothetical protein NYP18_04105 [Corynebacterium sp. YIM 101645]|uniref:Uncharacterized protein n=1 Tax=Corynebacterium lemuris TaxID=1859292 RepID=A0ABT2FVM8_9CORY|nr:hypothetical protein [Corynebacterium lemuris]MCS5478835.1 hypothetical protein [Corynebacterium lemuris]